MSERPTLNQLESDACHETGQFAAVQRYREMLDDHGYIIVHPDDVIVDSGWGDARAEADAFAFGWNACRSHIFGDAERSET